MKIHTTKKITKVGTSHYILVSAKELETLNISPETLLEVTLETDTTVDVECVKCKSRFAADSTQDVFDCPVCNEEMTKEKIIFVNSK